MSKQVEFKTVSFTAARHCEEQSDAGCSSGGWPLGLPVPDDRSGEAIPEIASAPLGTPLRNDGCNILFIILSAFIFVFLTLLAPAWASKDSRNPADWYERAHEDLEVAELLFKETNHYPVVCFHSHQAAEKALKGALTSRGERPDKTHLTADLAKQLSRYNPKSKMFINPLKRLDKFYVPSRYPKEGQKPFTKEEAFLCLERAKQIFDLAASEFSAASGV